MKPNQLIIIGGGNSISKGIELGLYNKLKNKFTCGINYSYRYFDSTYLCCMNYMEFYDINRKELSKLPLIITCTRPHPSKWEKNTILINKNFMLSGILALYIGIKLEIEEIYLLGYDYGKQNNKTHFYQGQIEHQGIGQDQYYNRGFEDRDFGIYGCTNSRIYNVSLDSKIYTFLTISYSQFFKQLDNSKYSQEELKKEIKRKLR